MHFSVKWENHFKEKGSTHDDNDKGTASPRLWTLVRKPVSRKSVSSFFKETDWRCVPRLYIKPAILYFFLYLFSTKLLKVTWFWKKKLVWSMTVYNYKGPQWSLCFNFERLPGICMIFIFFFLYKTNNVYIPPNKNPFKCKENKPQNLNFGKCQFRRKKMYLVLLNIEIHVQV